MNNLNSESFRFDLYKDNRTGFHTNRPLAWYNAFKQHLSTNNTKSRWELKRNKKKKITECKIHICFQNKQVTISINFTTGIIMVKGALFEEWIDIEFQFIQSIIFSDDSTVPIIDVKNKKNELETELEHLWVENTKLLTSIKWKNYQPENMVRQKN